MPRKILHLDLDAFFCAVEEKHNPALAGQPFAVGGLPDERGVVSSCSYAARQCGVRSAMPMRRAIQLCPRLIIVAPKHPDYEAVSRQVMKHLRQWTALVEQISIDEAFLDLSDLPDPGEMLARRIQADIYTSLGLPCSLGVASNKLVAKIATDAGKARHRGDRPPMAITIVPPGEEADFLAPMDVSALWGVGPKTAARFAELGIRTIGDLARWSEHDLAQLLGKMGHELFFRARGLDDRPIVIESELKSISQEITFTRDVRDGQALRETLCDLAETVGKRLRQNELAGATVRLKLRWADFTTITRQMTLPQPTDQGQEIFAAVGQLFEAAWQPGIAVRLIGVGVGKLQEAARQLSLWETEADKHRRLQRAVDDLQERFGQQAIRTGRKTRRP